VARGRAFATLPGEPPVRLNAGDVVLFPQGDGHVMSSAPGLRPPPSSTDMYFAPHPPQLPFSLAVEGGPDVTTAVLDGGGVEHATLVCGFLGLDSRPFNPLLAALPRVIHLPGGAVDGDAWVSSFLRMAVSESNRKRPGGEAVLERMSEMLFVEVLRRYVDTLPAEQTGWLAGMRDPVVGRVLSILHEKPAEAWTLERLGSEAGVSRSSLADRFVHFIGQPPMQYLASWRMQLAAARLRDTDLKVVDVALDVGYESEAAFSRAFKRLVGVAPGTWRRAHRSRRERKAR
jgi:AraC-like DNA-binding protein